MYLHHASKLLSKIHHKADMSQIPVEGLYHYTVVYGLTSTKMKDKVVGHQSACLNPIEDCFSNIHAFSVGYERVKSYSRADFDAPEAPVINNLKSEKELGPCFKFNGQHFQSWCMEKRSPK